METRSTKPFSVKDVVGKDILASGATKLTNLGSTLLVIGQSTERARLHSLGGMASSEELQREEI